MGPKGQQTIRIIPKAKAKIPIWVNTLVGGAVFLLVASLTAFLLLHFQIKSDEKKLENVKAEIVALESTEIKIIENDVLVLSKKIADFKSILESHLYPSKIFGFLGKICHPQSQFTNFEFVVDTSLVTLNGVTETFYTLGEQLLILFFESNISNLSVQQMQYNDEGTINFGVSFNINKNFFKP